MNLKQYILAFLLGTVIASVAWVMVLTNIDPVTAGVPALLAFYLTLFIALNGFFTTMATIVRAIIFARRNVEEVVTVSLRQGVLFSVLITGSLFLLSVELLNWWTLLLFIALVSLLEFFFLSTKKGSRR